MEENTSSTILEGQIVGIRFGLATQKEIVSGFMSFFFFAGKVLHNLLCYLYLYS